MFTKIISNKQSLKFNEKAVSNGNFNKIHKNFIIIAVFFAMVLILFSGCEEGSDKLVAGDIAMPVTNPVTSAETDTTVKEEGICDNANMKDAASAGNNMSKRENCDIVPGDTFLNEKQQYTITLPKGWKVAGQTSCEKEGVCECEDVFSRPDDKSTVIMVKSTDNVHGSDYDSISDNFIKAYLKASFEGSSGTWEEENAEIVYFNGDMTQLIEYNTVIKNSEQQIKKDIYLICFITDKKVYMVSAEGFGEALGTNAAEIKQALRSFKVHGMDQNKEAINESMIKNIFSFGGAE